MAELGIRPDEWPVISRRLDEALALAPGAHPAWLDSIAESDSIKRSLRALLAGAGAIETGDFLATLPKLTLGPSDRASAVAGGAGEMAAGVHVGPYRLIAELGRGGMGTVWLAEREDGQPRRKVALKLPYIGWAPGLGERLARERDILASLEHPHIARLYDAGIDQLGRPYLALEYVDGTPIDRYCKEHASTLRQRLGLVLQVAAAVAHAHTRLVVHRDLKPSNILVTQSGEVRLLDFGIAKLLLEDGGGAATELTQLAGRALTPDYASPEQIRGEAIGTPSDVYSLGVVAYELVASARPYTLKASGGANLAQAIAQVEAPLASRSAVDPALKRQLAGDIDAILNKALKKDPGERYPTVAALAEDIERHLANAPVGARPDTLGYRTRKFVVRHAVQVGAGALVLAATTIGAGVALWQAGHARSEAARAEQVKDFALSIFESADTDAGAGAATTAVDLLKSAQLRVETELAGRPEVATELMTAIGYSLLGQGKLEEAGALLAKAVALSNRELGARHRRTLAASVVYGEALVGLGRNTEAIESLTAAAAEARRQEAPHELIDALRWLGSAQIAAGDIDSGIASSEQAVAVLSSPLAPRVRKLDALEAWGSLANALVNDNRAGQVEAARNAVDLAKALYGDKITEPVINNRILLATGLAREGHAGEALAELTTLLADTRRVLGPEHPKVSFAAYFLGNARLEAGDVLGAVAAHRTALEVAQRTNLNGAYGLGMARYNLASALAAARLGDEALGQFDTATRSFREAGGPDAPLAFRSLSSRALVLVRLGQLDAAELAFAALPRAPAGADQAANTMRLALLRSLQMRHAEAVALARSGVEALSKHPSRFVRANADNALGTVLLAAGNAAEAVAPLQRALDVYAQTQVMVSPDRADAIAALARANAALGPPGAAKP